MQAPGRRTAPIIMQLRTNADCSRSIAVRSSSLTILLFSFVYAKSRLPTRPVARQLQYLHRGRKDILVVVLQIVQFRFVGVEQRRRVRHIGHLPWFCQATATVMLPVDPQGSAPLTTIMPTSIIAVGIGDCIGL